MLVRSLLAAIGLLHLASGLWMLLAPEHWYATVPGVIATGPFNPHFITDIALAFGLSGIGLMLGARRGTTPGAFAVAGTAWPAAHGLFHLWEWLTDGVPQDPMAATTALIGVMLPGLAGAVLAWMRSRQDHITGTAIP